MTRRSKVYVTMTFNDGEKRVIGPLSSHDGGRLYRMAERNMLEFDLHRVRWSIAEHNTPNLAIATPEVSHDAY